MNIDHVKRLQTLGLKILDVGGKCNSQKTQKLKSDCEKVGLKMVRPVTNILLTKFTDNLYNFTSLSIKEKKEFIYSNINIFDDNKNLKYIKNNYDMTILYDDQNLEKITKIMLDLEDEQINAIYILLTIICDNNYNLSDFFIEQIYNLIINIIQEKDNIHFLDIQYGGGNGFALFLGIVIIVIQLLTGTTSHHHHHHHHIF